jgi:hypothetical protein
MVGLALFVATSSTLSFCLLLGLDCPQVWLFETQSFTYSVFITCRSDFLSLALSLTFRPSIFHLNHLWAQLEALKPSGISPSPSLSTMQCLSFICAQEIGMWHVVSGSTLWLISHTILCRLGLLILPGDVLKKLQRFWDGSGWSAGGEDDLLAQRLGHNSETGAQHALVSFGPSSSRQIGLFYTFKPTLVMKYILNFFEFWYFYFWWLLDK